MTPLPQTQVQQAVQILLSALSDERCVTPNNLLDGVASAKSILRGIISGQFVVCVVKPAPQPAPVEAPKTEETVDEA